MPKDTTSKIPPTRLERYERLVASQAGVERRGVTVPYTSVNGHMFSFLTESGTLALRLPRGEREAFLERYATTLHQAHGTVMKEYVSIPDALFADTGQLAPYFAMSYLYVSALKPKPTRRSR